MYADSTVAQARVQFMDLLNLPWDPGSVIVSTGL